MPKKASTQSRPLPTLPSGVYMDVERQIAIVISRNESGLWFLTWKYCHIKLNHCSEEKFKRDHPHALPEYPILRAVRKFNESSFAREPKVQAIMDKILEPRDDA